MMVAIVEQDRRSVELSVVGSMVLYDVCAEWAAVEIPAAAFSSRELRTLFRCACDMHTAGKPIDRLTIADELTQRGEFTAAGGVDGIMAALEAVPHAAHLRYYGRQLMEFHRRDQIRDISERCIVLAKDPTSETDETIAKALSDLEAVRAGQVTKSELMTAADALAEMDQRTSDSDYVIPTGLADVNRQLNSGLRPGQLIVFGGRPGTGKSALMAQMILAAARKGKPGLIASLEMTAAEHAERALKSIPRETFAGLPVWFSVASDFAKLTGLIRLAKRQHGIALAAVDYLQLMESPIGRNDLRERQVATMSRGLKRLAMELQIPILLGSQLNRESEKRGRPSLADLRESGAIEQDADIVVLIAGDAESDERELIIAKHRGGACGIVKVYFDRPNFVFRNSADAVPWHGRFEG